MAVDDQGWPPESALDAGDADEADASGRYLTPRGIRWYVCDKCGFLYPSDETVIDDITGRRVCTIKCQDEYDENDPRLGGNYFSRVFTGQEETIE